MKKTEAYIEFRSEELNDILTCVPSKLIRWGSLIFLALIVFLLVLLWCIKYPDIISAEAYLTTPELPQKLYAKTTARIDTVMVSNNQQVNKNMVLAILENAAINRDVMVLKSVIDTVSINQGHIIFPFKFLPVLFLGELDKPFSDFEKSYFKYIMNRDLQPYSNRMLTSASSLFQLQNQLNNLLKQQVIHKKEINFIQKDLKRHELLLEKGVISQQNYDYNQIAYYSALKQFENTKFTISQLKASIESARGNSKELEFMKYREDVNLLKEVMQNYGQLKKSIKDWELKYVLKTNRKGKLSFLNQFNSNQTVVKDELMFVVFSENNPYYVAKLKTPKTNSGKIKVGQRVNLKLNDYPEYEFGVLVGVVQSITSMPDNIGTYIVDVKIPKHLKTSFGKNIIFKQDMHGAADIITEDLRLLERLFYQFRNLYSN
ncbi:HlyD family secretion protein [Mariniflexile ostreae]|uniref:HlyD family secretion protein n=1 Tax=Mariniflexile ostreae TaxID=1520892 RepID=A0ABV5FF15_9FLAO